MISSSLSAFDRAHGKRGEFGELARHSGRTLNERSLAQLTGAENLLTKALESTAIGNLDRAEQLIARAAAMSYDAREEGSPGVRGASMLIYNLVAEQFESSDYDNHAWLDVALDVHPHLDGPGRAELASLMHGYVLQEAFYTLSPGEKQRIREAFGDAPLEAHLGDGPDLAVEGRRDIIRSLVAAALKLRAGYSAAASQS